MADNIGKIGWIDMSVDDDAVSGICHARCALPAPQQ